MIPKILIDNLFDDGFAVKQMSNIVFVLKRTVLRSMIEDGLKIWKFSNVFDNQLYSDVSSPTKDHPFYGETFLRKRCKTKLC